jgi:uncharacterized protein (DUF58 family)
LNANPKTDGLTWISQQKLIQLRHDAGKLPLNSSKIHARQGGAYMSSFRGRGMEFDESRLYMPGDDIRNMDWRVTARTGEPHTKVFREERERPVLIWLDLNASMFFGTRGCFKSVAAAKAAALLAWSTAMHNDRLGALIFGGDDHIELKPRRGKSAVLDLIGRTCKHPAWHAASHSQARDAGHAMSRLRKVTRPGSLLFLISDFRNMDEKAESHLINVARHNDVVLIQVHDPVEADLPPAGVYRVSDGTDDLQLNTTDRKLRREYHQRFEQRQSHLATLCRQHRMYLLPLSTETDVLVSLQQGLGIPGSKHAQFRARR